MKRDLDLCRQLLAEIEGRGPNSALSALSPGLPEVSQDSLRHQVDLLIDAGLVEQVEQTPAGSPCLRLTHQGHELLELSARPEVWGDAKQLVIDRTGGQSLSVVLALLTKWAIEAISCGPAPREGRKTVRRRVDPRRSTALANPYTEPYEPTEPSETRSRDGLYWQALDSGQSLPNHLV